MNKEQFDSIYANKAVHCDTEDKANAFLKLAHSVGYKGCGKNNTWHIFDKDTCYFVGEKYIGVCSTSTNHHHYKENIVEFAIDKKENNMKLKVGDKARVRSNLEVGRFYGVASFVTHMKRLIGKQVTIKRVYDDVYHLEEDEDVWNWTDEMLEPVEETFCIGDIVYDKDGNKGEVTAVSYLVLFEHSQETRYAYEISKTKPLKKITRKELADKGYELVD